MDWPFILGVFFPILPDRLQTTLLKNMQLNDFPSSNSFMWMTNICFLFKTDAMHADYTSMCLMKLLGDQRKLKI